MTGPHRRGEGEIMEVRAVWKKNYQVADTDVFTGAPLVVKDMIIVPGSGADLGIG